MTYHQKIRDHLAFSLQNIDTEKHVTKSDKEEQKLRKAEELIKEVSQNHQVKNLS